MRNRALLIMSMCSLTSYAQNAVSVDYTGDCFLDSYDAGEFIRAFGRGSMEAELTGDGLIDLMDIMAFVKALPNDPGEFTVHWCVTTHYGKKPTGFGYRMDGSVGEDPNHPDLDTSLLPVVKDTCILYDHVCEEFPTGGVHEMLLRFGDPDLWAESYSAWRAAHRADLLQRIPELLTSRNPPYTHCSIDYENPNPRWVDMRKNQAWGDPDMDRRCKEWEALVDEVNSPAWDPDFFESSGFTPPQGTVGIDELTLDEREPAYQASYDLFARRLFLVTLNAARAADDAVGDVKWSFWKYPRVPHDLVVNDDWRERNDDLAWLYRNVDVLTPWFYRRRYTSWDPNDPNSCDPARTRSPERQAAVWASAMVECHRLRDAYNPGAEIIPFVWWHYDLAAGDCHFEVLNDLDASESLRIPRRWGASGVYIWGYLNPSPDDYYSALPLPRDEVENVLNLQWRDLLWNAVCQP